MTFEAFWSATSGAGRPKVSLASLGPDATERVKGRLRAMLTPDARRARHLLGTGERHPWTGGGLTGRHSHSSFLTSALSWRQPSLCVYEAGRRGCLIRLY